MISETTCLTQSGNALRRSHSSADHARLLVEFARKLHSVHDLSAFSQTLTEEVQKTLPVDVAGVLVENRGEFSLEWAPQRERPEIASFLNIAKLTDLASRVLLNDRAIQAPDLFLADANARQYLFAAPIRSARIRGVLAVVSSSPLTSEDMVLFDAMASIASLSVSTVDLREDVPTRADDLRQLLGIRTELSGTTSLEEFLQKAVVIAPSFLGFRQSFLGLMEDDACAIHWILQHGSPVAVNWPLDTSLTKRILSEKETFWSSERWSDECLPETTRTSLYQVVPLLGAEGRVLGVLGLMNREEGSPNFEDDRRRTEALASEISVALRIAKSRHLAEQHRARAEQLVALAQELSSSLSLLDLVRSFTARSAEILSARRAVLALAQGSALRTVTFTVPELGPDKYYSERLNQTLAEFCRHQAASFSYFTAKDFVDKELGAHLGWKDFTLAKLHSSEGELLGALCLVDRGKPLSSDEEQMLHGLLAHASVALENSRLFTRIIQSSKQWAEIFDSISDFIVVHNSEHRITRTNRSLADFLQERPSELIGAKIRDVFLANSEGPAMETCPFCDGAAAPGESRRGDTIEFVHPSTERVYLISTSKVPGSALEGPTFVHVLKDVTESREAARRYRELFDNIHEGAYFSTPNGRFVEVNDALVRMLGYDSREELMEIDIPSQLYTSSDHRSGLTTALNEGDLRNYEGVLRRKDGSLVHVLENGFAVRDQRGNIVQFRGVILDISQIKEVQSQLRHEHDFNTQILNHTQSMILVADTAGLVSYANRKYFASNLRRNGDLLGNRLIDIVPSSHRRVLQAAFDTVLAGNPVSNLELPVTSGDKIVGRYSLNLSPMRDQLGNVNSIVTVMTDVSDVAMLQAKLVQTEKMVAVGQLVSGVAHEVNNPLTAIMGFADLMLYDADLPEHFQKDLKVIVQEAERTKEIVQNLLSFARQMPAEHKAVQINEVLKKTLSLRSYDFSSHAVEITENFDADLPQMTGDPHQLQQVFLNIINNAYDAVRETSRPGRIEITTRYVDGFVEVQFIDNGPGVKNLERIFDPFFTTKEVGKGTGLGLSICYGIVREHGGEILCENGQEVGAVFRVRFPIAARVSAKPSAF